VETRVVDGALVLDLLAINELANRVVLARSKHLDPHLIAVLLVGLLLGVPDLLNGDRARELNIVDPLLPHGGVVLGPTGRNPWQHPHFNCEVTVRRNEANVVFEPRNRAHNLLVLEDIVFREHP
jgi:hypothetical protein